MGYAYHSEPTIDQYHYSPSSLRSSASWSTSRLRRPSALDLAPVASVEPHWVDPTGRGGAAFVSFAETLRKLGRIEYTRQGRVSKPFLARLTRALGWEATLASDPLTPLPEAPLFFLRLFAAAGVLRALPNEAVLGIEPDVVALFELPVCRAGARWVRAYRVLTGWIEYMPGCGALIR